MGAYLRCNGLLQNPRLLAVLSPSTQRWPVAKRSLRSWKRSARKSSARALFISQHGSREYGPFAEPIISYQQRLIARQYPGLALSTQELSGMGHTGGKVGGLCQRVLWALQGFSAQRKAACK